MAKKDKPNDADLSTDLLMREVDEDVRAERLRQWWQRFGSTLVSAIIAIVLATIGYEVWQNHQQNESEKLTTQLLASEKQAENGNELKAAQGLAEFAEGSALAQIHAAHYYIASGEEEKASSLYKKVSQRKDDPALSHYTKLQLDEVADFDAKSPFYYFAIEKQMVDAYTQGDKAKAKELLAMLTLQPAVPETMRRRIMQLQQFIGQ